MRNVLLILLLVVISPHFSQAQNNDCFGFFPNNIGTELINKTYNSSDSLLSTFTCKILDSYEHSTMASIELAFVMSDGNNVQIDRGTINAHCNDGELYLSMDQEIDTSVNVTDMLSLDTEIVSNFLSYPEPNISSSIYDNKGIEETSFTVKSKEDKDDFMRVNMYNRKYIKNEKVNTPAGSFDAAMVTFEFEVYHDKETKRYKGVEWYAIDAGIVRSETYDLKNNLLNYTVLSEIKKDDKNKE